MILPSKELLSAVLDSSIRSYELSPNGNVLYALKDDVSVSDGMFINIYELMHMMKEYAFSKGYVIYSGRRRNDTHKSIMFKVSDYGNCNKGNHAYSDTEFEAVVKSCKWLLKEQNV